jgi:DNA polymerase-3 subunit gamma/tau
LIEEPPQKTVFVLCTTDPQKIPQTVLSRLVKIDFKKGGNEELRRSLKRIIEGEEIEIGKEAINLIVEKSDGSFRNIARMFNEIVVSLGKKIELADLEKYFSKKGGDYGYDELVADLAQKEIKKILESFEKMAEAGVDFSGYRHEFLDYLQKKLLAEYGLGGERSVLSQLEISKLMNILIGVGRYEKEVEIGQLPMEMAVVEFVSGLSGSGDPSRGGVNKEKEKKEIKNSSSSRVSTRSKGEGIKEEESLKEEEVVEEPKMVILTQGVEEIEKKWHEILAAVKPFNHSVEAFLRAARPREVVKGELVMEVFYPFHKDKLEEPRNRQIVEVGLEKVLGQKMVFKCVLGNNKKPALVIDNNYKMEETKEKLSETETAGGDIYDLAKEIFG